MKFNKNVHIRRGREMQNARSPPTWTAFRKRTFAALRIPRAEVETPFIVSGLAALAWGDPGLAPQFLAGGKT
jgi:hypothetical protein